MATGDGVQILGYIFALANVSYELHQYPPSLDWGTHVKTASQPCIWTGALGLPAAIN